MIFQFYVLLFEKNTDMTFTNKNEAENMATTNVDLIDGIILKRDIYKDNVLLLKRGAILNPYLLDKLNKFGFNSDELDDFVDKSHSEMGISQNTDKYKSLKVLVLQCDDFKAFKTKNILVKAGFENDEIMVVKDLQNQNLRDKNIVCIFVDSKLYNDDFVNDVTLLSNRNKIVIFVLGCDECMPENISFNSDYQTVKFLHRPLASSYVNALLQLYS